MPRTYDLIATTTLSSNSASVTLSSISQSYSHLVVSAYVPSFTVSGDIPGVRFNADTSQNYKYFSWKQTNASSPTTDYSFSPTFLDLMGGAGNTEPDRPATFLLNILDYTFSPQMHGQFGLSLSNSSGNTGRYVSRYKVNNAITSITFMCNGTAQYTTGSRFSIYGILKA